MINKDWKKRWESIVKEDQDWDYTFIDSLLKRKLELMYDFYSNPTNTTNSDEKNSEICSQIKEVLDLWKKVETYWYHDKSSKFYEEHCKPIMEKTEIKLGDKSIEGIQHKDEWDSDENRLKYLEITEAECAEEDADEEKVFTLIAKYRRNWWD